MKRHLFAIVLITAVLVAAPIENVLSFQGKLVEGGVPVDGTRNINFKIYNVATGGVSLWEENHLGVPVVNGLFNVELGGTTTFGSAGVDFSEQYWIGISVSGGAEITPRYKLTNMPYSLNDGPWENAGSYLNPKGPISDNLLVADTQDFQYGFYSNMNNSTGPGYGGYFKHSTAGSSSSYGIYGEANYTGSTNPNYNYAGYFKSNSTTRDGFGVYCFSELTSPTGSGYTRGIYGRGLNAGIGSSYGGYFYGYISNSTSSAYSYGVYAQATRDLTSIVGNNYGVYAVANYGATSYGIFATAAGGSTNWAGYFNDGNVYIRNKTGIGTANPQYPLHVVNTVATHSSANSPTVYAMVTDGTDSLIGILAGENGFQGVYGKTTRNSGFGVKGVADCVNGVGVYGSISANSGVNYGMMASASGSGATSSYGVSGYASSSSGTNYGCRGSASGSGATANYGVYGLASGATVNYGVLCSGNGGYTGSWSNVSDIKFKKNIRPMEGILDKIMMLKPKTFEMRTDEFSFMNLNEGTQYGLIAQELVEVFPELVSQGHHPGETNHETREIIHEGVDYTQVDYIPLTAILVRAIQEQQQMIDSQQTQIEELKAENNEFRTRIEALEKN